MRDLRITADTIREGRASLKPTSWTMLFGVSKRGLDRSAQKLIDALDAPTEDDK